jgi:hypothetical protein
MANRDSPADTPALWSQPEPDLKVVVGGKEFWHYSALLRRASEYFDKMLSSESRESRTGIIVFSDGDPEEWVRFFRYLEPRSLFTTKTFQVNEEDAKALLPWFHQFGMTNLLQECDERLSSSSPKFSDDDLNDVEHQRSTMMEILKWADTATIYDLSETLDAMMKELEKAVNSFPEMITTEILEAMRLFWSTTAGTELWEAVKAILPDDVKSSHDDATLQANEMLIELLAQSCKVPAQIRTLKSEAFNAIVNLMKKYRSRPRIQEEGCATFRDPILRNDDNHLSNAVKGGIEAVVSAMTAHSNVSKVQEWGCAALGNLACNDANCVSIASNHGIEAVVSAMAAHRDVLNVQEWACVALSNLAWNNNANCESIAAKHGIEAIVGAMTAHYNVSKVQECGCLALANLADNDANCVSIAAKDSIEAVVSAMTAHSNISDVQEYGCVALANLAENNDANCVSIAAKDGIEAIVGAMTAYTNISEVQKWGCLALANLASSNDANRVSIATKDGIEAIVSAMTAYTNVSEVQKRGCLALFNLTCSESLATRIQLAGGLAVLEQNPNNFHAEEALRRIKASLNLG